MAGVVEGVREIAAKSPDTFPVNILPQSPFRSVVLTLSMYFKHCPRSSIPAAASDKSQLQTIDN